MFEKLKKMVDNAEKIAIFTHEHPDGDALGSSFAFALGLLENGKCTNVFLADFNGDTKEYKLICGKDKLTDIKAKDCDLKIALDCADFDRIALADEDFSGNTAAIDHHITHKNYANETIVVDAPATGEIVFDILTEWDIKITSEIANNLYIAIACDTGNFKFSSTTSKTHRCIASLIECGADYAGISRALFYKMTKEYIALYQTALNRLEFFAEGKGCLMYLCDEDFKNAKINEDGAGDIVNLPAKIEGVEVGAYIRKRESIFKVSLRSGEYVDVAQIASEYGGGGHIRAAGFSSSLPIEELKNDIKDRIEKGLKEI